MTKLKTFLLNSYKYSQALRPSNGKFHSLAAKWLKECRLYTVVLGLESDKMWWPGRLKFVERGVNMILIWEIYRFFARFAIQSREHIPINSLVIISIYFFFLRTSKSTFCSKKHHVTNVLSEWNALKFIFIRIFYFRSTWSVILRSVLGKRTCPEIFVKLYPLVV